MHCVSDLGKCQPTQDSHYILSWRISSLHRPKCNIIVRSSCFVMAEKQQTSPYRESHSCSVKFVYPVSFVSLLICVTALVRVEIINQRVHTVEELVAEVRQTTSRELASNAVNSKPTERASRSASEVSDHMDFKDKRDETQGNLIST